MSKLTDVEPICRLPAPPRGWYDYDYEVLDDGRLVLVRVNTDVAAVSVHERAQVWPKARLRLSCFDGTTESDVLELAAVPWPKVGKLPDGRWLVVQSRCSWSARNVSIFNPDGSRGESFAVGDGVGPIVCLPDGRLWVGYIDQGVFGDPRRKHPASSGLAAFDINGVWVGRFAHQEYAICDCYALGATGTVVWACTYTDFPIIRIDGGGVRLWHNSIDGPFAIAANDTHVMLAGGYHADANRLVLLRLEGRNAVPVDEFRLETDDGKIEWLGRNGTKHAIAGSEWLQIRFNDWLATVW